MGRRLLGLDPTDLADATPKRYVDDTVGNAIANFEVAVTGDDGGSYLYEFTDDGQDYTDLPDSGPFLDGGLYTDTDFNLAEYDPDTRYHAGEFVRHGSNIWLSTAPSTDETPTLEGSDYWMLISAGLTEPVMDGAEIVGAQLHQSLVLNDFALYLRQYGDLNHSVRWGYTDHGVDGPVVNGFTGVGIGVGDASAHDDQLVARFTLDGLEVVDPETGDLIPVATQDFVTDAIADNAISTGGTSTDAAVAIWDGTDGKRLTEVPGLSAADDGTFTARKVVAHPASGEAVIVWNNGTQQWKWYNNGNFGIYNDTTGRGPLQVTTGAPDMALKLDTTQNTMAQPLAVPDLYTGHIQPPGDGTLDLDIGPLKVAGNKGTAGQVLTSGGATLSPTWEDNIDVLAEVVDPDSELRDALDEIYAGHSVNGGPFVSVSTDVVDGNDALPDIYDGNTTGPLLDGGVFA